MIINVMLVLCMFFAWLGKWFKSCMCIFSLLLSGHLKFQIEYVIIILVYHNVHTLYMYIVYNMVLNIIIRCCV